MHACGHDAHMSMGLAVAHWIMDNKEKLSGKIKIIFQPAEEGVRGAAGVAASGILRTWPCSQSPENLRRTYMDSFAQPSTT